MESLARFVASLAAPSESEPPRRPQNHPPQTPPLQMPLSGQHAHASSLRLYDIDWRFEASRNETPLVAARVRQTQTSFKQACDEPQTIRAPSDEPPMDWSWILVRRRPQDAAQAVQPQAARPHAGSAAVSDADSLEIVSNLSEPNTPVLHAHSGQPPADAPQTPPTRLHARTLDSPSRREHPTHLSSVVSPALNMARTASAASAAAELFARANGIPPSAFGLQSAVGGTAASTATQQPADIGSFILLDRTSSRGSFRGGQSVHADIGDSPILVPLPTTFSALAGAVEGPPPFALDPALRPPSAALSASSGRQTPSQKSPDQADAPQTSSDAATPPSAPTTTESCAHSQPSESPKQPTETKHADSTPSKKSIRDLLDDDDDLFGFNKLWHTDPILFFFGYSDDDSLPWIVFRIVSTLVAAGVGGYILTRLTSSVHRIVSDQFQRLLR